MKKPHFFKAKSQLGCTGILYDGGKFNSGVERGPDAILNQEFLQKLGNPVISPYIFPHPQEIAKNELVEVLVTNFGAFRDYINQKLQADEMPIVIGGDHSIAFSAIMAALDRVKNPRKLGYIQFDSHGDMNLFATSPSKNFHGMYLRPLIDDFDIPEIKQLIRHQLLIENILFVGNLDLDPEEKKFFTDQKIKNITGKEVRNNLPQVLQQIETFINSFPYLHISLDVDVFDQSIMPATGIPNKDGLLKEEVLAILDIINKHPNISFDLSEVNPLKAGAPESIELTQMVIEKIIVE